MAHFKKFLLSNNFLYAINHESLWICSAKLINQVGQKKSQ